MAIILQDYERLKFLGKGAFAQIYKVRHKDLGYVRAIKVLTEEVNEGEDDKVYKTFLKECSLLLRIGNGGHPNIIRIYQPRKIDGKALVEMDYIDGVTLESFVSEKRFLPIDEVYRFIKEIGSALAYCHVDCYRYMMRPEEKDQDPKDLIQKYGVAHNDIHSNNIMRKELDGSYVLLDFGLAIQDDKAVKESSRDDGAAEYIPPEKWAREQISNEKAVDIYGFGILMYQMLTGQVPFVLDPNEYKKDSLKTLNTIRHRHENERPAEILPLRKAAYEKATGKSDYERDYPEWLDELIFRCLEKKPENRFHDAKELQEFFTTHLKDDLSSTEKTIDALRKSNKALSQKVKDLESRIEETKNHPPAPGPNDANLEEELRKAKTELEETKAELSKLIAAYSGYPKFLEEKDKRLNDKDKEIEALKKSTGRKNNTGAVVGLSILSSVLAIVLAWGGVKYSNETDALRAKLNEKPTTGQVSSTTASSTSSNETDLQAEISRLEGLIKQKDSEIEKANKQISTLQSEVSQKDKQIATLQASDQSETVTNLQQKVRRLESQVKTLTSERDDLKEKLKNLINSTL